tara:strand:+ start:126 stop:491 length:366 start_codon:yes stop_codon:yes gene_type:complete
MADIIFSQGNNLQFNQVVNQDFTTTGSGIQFSSAGTISVGTNQVLKITSFSGFRGENEQHYMYIKIDNKLIYSNNGNGNYVKADTPIWLGTGNYSVYIRGQGTSSQNLSFSISGVEFNLVQ